ncbi:MAG TPA: NAD(P)-binding domain-containing protein [Phnomibacter sp.]|nr:NAD(P)-binding domain-containing protein [Phnomibacter sp.]
MNLTSQKVGVLGSGMVGRVLASAFLSEGASVMLSARSAEKQELKDWQSKNTQGLIGSFADAAASADIIVLAVQGEHATNALELAGQSNLAGKIVIDATNPISHSLPPVNGVLQYFTNANESLMERLQDQFAEARFVKAFNSVGNAFMYKPDFGGTKPTMFICGNDADAKAMVTSILDNFGWEVEDMGMVQSARPIEALCILWCAPGFLRNQWTHAFKLLKK